MPPDQEAYRRGLAGVDDTAQVMFGAGFLHLPRAQQDAVVQSIADGQPPGAVWVGLSASYWFEELLVETTEIYFAHPLSQQDMGYLGMADAQGWDAVGLDEKERPLPANDHAA
jgi:hypothetical protein